MSFSTKQGTLLAVLLVMALFLSVQPAASSGPPQPIPKASVAPAIRLPERVAPVIGLPDVVSPASNPSVCMTVASTDLTSLPTITTRICRQSNDQLWEPDAQGYWHTALDPTYCLAEGSSGWSPVTVRPCTDSRAVRLEREATGDVYVVQGDNRRALDLDVANNRLTLYWRGGGTNQQWRWLAEDVAITEANSNETVAYPLALSNTTAQRLEAARDRIAKMQPPYVVPLSAVRDASIYPGAVPGGSPTVSASYDFDLRFRDPALLRISAPSKNWLTTGLYASPGGVVTLTVSGATEAELRDVYVQLGVHTDALNTSSGNVVNASAFQRYAQIAMRIPLLPGANQVRTPYGGAIILGSDSSVDKTITVAVAGAVQAPHFVAGQTTEAQWLTLRDAPAPWAALEGSHAVLHIPSARARVLSYSDALLITEWYSRVVQLHNELSGFSDKGPESHYPPQGKYPFVVDRQISAGSAHAGFPMMFFDWYDLENPENARRNTDTAWGVLHELGHDYQMPLWSSIFGTEVTVNFWSLYGQHRLYGLSRIADGNEYARAVDLLNDPTKPDKWNSADNWGKLVFLDQIRLGFPTLDWNLWTQMMRRYRQMSPTEAAALDTDQKKRDRFMTLLCEITNSDLTPHFQKWTIAVTQTAKDTCNAYPDLTQELWLLDATKPLNAGTGSGQLLHERWTNVAGSQVTDLLADPRYPASPTTRTVLTGQLETPSNMGDTYGERLRGYLHPPVTGEYVFWIASDDSARFRLSSNTDPANAQTLLDSTSWVGERQFDQRAESRSVPVSLVAGQRYYIEVLHKEGGGGDNLALAWAIPSGPEGSSESRKIIAGRFFSPYALTDFPASSSEGLLAAFDFDESSGATSFADASGLGKTGTCTGDGCPLAGESGRIGKAARFDGAGDTVTANVTLPNGPFTLAAWVNYSGSSWTWRSLLVFGGNTPWFGVTPAGQLSMYPTLTGGQLPTGEWAHVLFSYSGAPERINRLYVNGRVVQEVANTTPYTGGTPLYLGSDGDGNFPWLGRLDTVRVYNRALSGAEIEALANPGQGVLPTPNSHPDTPLVSGSLTGGAQATGGETEQVRYIDLTVSVYRPLPTAADRAPYEAILGHFADAVYEMSNGAHRIRTVTLYDDGRFSDQANVVWAFNEWPRARLAGYGQPSQQLVMADTFAFPTPYDPLTPANQRGAGYVLAQQWGYYFYGLQAEYPSAEGDTPPLGGSVMNSPWAAATDDDYGALNFSSIASTDAVGQTQSEQFRAYHASGWETLLRGPQHDPHGSRNVRPVWPDLAAVAPDADSLPSIELPAGQATARAALSFVWERDAAPRGANGPLTERVFLLDLSAEMGEANRMASLKRAITHYLDAASDDDQIALLTFGDHTALVLPLAPVGDAASRARLKGQINSLVLGVEGHEGEAITEMDSNELAAHHRYVLSAAQQALTLLSDAPAGDRAVYLFTSGGFTDPVPDVYGSLCQEYAHAGVPLSIYNFAPTSHEDDPHTNSVALLQALAACAGGTYHYVGADDFALGAALVGEETRLTELVHGLRDAEHEHSPILDVNLGTERGVVVTPESPFTMPIFVDPTLDEFELFVAYEGEFDNTLFYLDPPSGELPPGTVAYCDTDGQMHLCTITIADPEEGVWSLEVDALAGAVPLEFRGTGFTLSGLTYQASLRSLAGSAISFPGEIVLEASVFEVDPIADAGVNGWVETPSGAHEAVDFYDDGIAPDDIAGDGLYHAILDYQQDGDYRVTVVFDNISGGAYYSTKSFLRGPDPAGTVAEIPDYLVGDDFDRFATLELFVSGYGDDDHGDEQASSTDLPPTNHSLAGHIDHPADVDLFRLHAPLPIEGDPRATNGPVTSAPQTYVLRLDSFSAGMEAEVTIWQGGEAETFHLSDLDYDHHFYTPLSLRAGETVYVEVRHSDEGADQGRYHISFGDPLPNELLPTTIYLPLISRD